MPLGLDRPACRARRLHRYAVCLIDGRSSPHVCKTKSPPPVEHKKNLGLRNLDERHKRMFRSLKMDMQHSAAAISRDCLHCLRKILNGSVPERDYRWRARIAGALRWATSLESLPRRWNSQPSSPVNSSRRETGFWWSVGKAGNESHEPALRGPVGHGLHGSEWQGDEFPRVFRHVSVGAGV